MAKAQKITDDAVASFACGKYQDGDRKGQQKEQDVLWDREINGFGLRLSRKSGTRSYLYRYRRPGSGKEVYINIGRHGFPYTAATARAEAAQLYSMVLQGKDPQEEERKYHETQRAREKEDEVQSLTLRQVMEHYLEHGRTRTGRRLRPKTKADYRAKLGRYVSDWMDRPMVTTVTHNACLARFRHLSDTQINKKTREQGIRGSANFLMTYLRRLCNYARKEYRHPDGTPRIFALNPVSLALEARNLNPTTCRKERIPKDRIGACWNELRKLANDRREDVRIAAEWLSVVMLTGARLSESAALLKANVDLKAKTIHLPGECETMLEFDGTKNHNPLTLPLSAPLVEILQKRMATCQHPNHPYKRQLCFPSVRGEKVPFISSPRSTIDKLKEVAGVDLSTHSLRRTYADVMRYAKVDPDERRLILNHVGIDVHQSNYENSSDPEALRDGMDAAAAWVLEQAQIAAGSNVIPFPSKTAKGG